MKKKIDPSVWINYFNEFTRRNQSRSTRLEVFGELGAQEAECGLPFAGIALDTAGGTLPSVEIMLGSHDTIAPSHLTHVIANVQEIIPKRGSDGRDEALQIISAEGEMNLLRFELRDDYAGIVNTFKAICAHSLPSQQAQAGVARQPYS